MSNDSAPVTIRELGKHGKLHIADLASTDAPSKHFMQLKKRAQDCSFWERKLQGIADSIENYNIPLVPEIDDPPRLDGDALEILQGFMAPRDEELTRFEGFKTLIDREVHELQERHAVLTICRQWEPSDSLRRMRAEASVSSGAGLGLESKEVELEEVSVADPAAPKFRNDVCGCLPSSKQAVFQRMLYRLTRGNALLKLEQIPHEIVDPASGVPMEKTVFMIVVLGSELLTRVRKVCAAMQATVYDTPHAHDLFDRELKIVENALGDKELARSRTQDAIVEVLQKLAYTDGRSPIRDWQAVLNQEKLVCEALMKCQYSSQAIFMEGWVPTAELTQLHAAVERATTLSGAPAAVKVDPDNPLRDPGSPPTYFVTNKYTHTFQNIVDTYGIPRYQEVNPGLFTIVTFPFLYAVMYGDIGHGFFLALFGYLLVKKEASFEQKIRNKTMGEIESMAYSGRYVILLMGIFTVYCGAIYNDVFSLSINAFGSGFDLEGDKYVFTGKVFPFGFDPQWTFKPNELAFKNSFKMKLAVILGVIQMVFGLCLALMNHVYFKDVASIVFEFIPRMLFLCCTFGYMIIIIIYKWCQDWTNGSPPNLVQTMIAMFLQPGTIEDDKRLYSGQAGVQVALLIIAFLSVPVMLVGKPFANKQKKSLGARAARYDFDHPDEEAGMGGHVADVGLGLEPGPLFEEKALGLGFDSSVMPADDITVGRVHSDEESSAEESFSDEMINQSIHTIEFVLGTVSNTASYLRLWALSLAHSELARVFWDKMVMEYGIQGGNVVGAVVGFAIWAAANFAVLLCMDMLECFLHALRLHWVEFQNKFFYADGYKFEPFSFRNKSQL